MHKLHKSHTHMRANADERILRNTWCLRHGCMKPTYYSQDHTDTIYLDLDVWTLLRLNYEHEVQQRYDANVFYAIFEQLSILVQCIIYSSVSNCRLANLIIGHISAYNKNGIQSLAFRGVVHLLASKSVLVTNLVWPCVWKKKKTPRSFHSRPSFFALRAKKRCVFDELVLFDFRSISKSVPRQQLITDDYNTFGNTSKKTKKIWNLTSTRGNKIRKSQNCHSWNTWGKTWEKEKSGELLLWLGLVHRSHAAYLAVRHRELTRRWPLDLISRLTFSFFLFVVFELDRHTARKHDGLHLRLVHARNLSHDNVHLVLLK